MLRDRHAVFGRNQPCRGSTGDDNALHGGEGGPLTCA